MRKAPVLIHHFGIGLLLALSLLVELPSIEGPVWAIPFPQPDPPEFFFAPAAPSRIPSSVPLGALPTTEWTFHKTADNLHPDGNEQQMMWLMNRARANPAAEGVYLANLDNPDVVSAVTNLNLDLDLMQGEFNAIPPKPPAAFDVRLFNAAYEHSLYMISINFQTHDGQNIRVDNSGFSYSTLRGSVFAYSKSGVHCHAALNIDWGASSDGTGMQPGRGHRVSIMSIDRSLYNVGIAMVPTDNSYPNAGPLVMTGNYATAFISSWSPLPNHYNRFLVGTVWDDKNHNSFYDPGEGLSGVTIMPSVGSFYAVTSNSGGYAIPLVQTGVCEISFSGNSVPAGSVRTRRVDQDSILLDFVLGVSPKGDINGDGMIDLADAVLTMKIVSGILPSAFIPPESDVNSDGKIGLNEAIFVLQKSSRLR